MKSKLLFLCVFVCLFLTSCHSNLEAVPTESQTPSPVITLVEENLPSLTPTPIVRSTTVNNSDNETSTVVEESLCELPCWQGVFPDVTNWTDLGLPIIDDQIVRNSIIRKYARQYVIDVVEENGKFRYIDDYNYPDNYESIRTPLYVSSIDLETIQRVDIGVNHGKNPYTISSLFQLYGMPSDFRVWKHFKGSGFGFIHVGFYFPEYGIVARSDTRYEGPNIGVREICLDERVSLELWNPEKLQQFESYSAYYISVTYSSNKCSLPSRDSIVNNLNIDSYEDLLQQLESSQYCFEFNLDEDW